MRDNAISGHTRIFGLIGHPVRHSLSPAMYNALFERFGIDAVYLAFEVDPNRASEVANIIRVMGLEGVNLTVPFKERLIDEMNTVSEDAKATGAINVILHRANELTGHNTDGEGFVRSLAEDNGPELDGITAVILGAGGAARAVASGLISNGARHIHLLNRTRERAQETANALLSCFPDAQISVDSLTEDAFAAHAHDARLVVNCTSGAASDTIAHFDPGLLASDAAWVDINYWMATPPCQNACEAAGVRFHDGLGMLAYQGALAFELFTGQAVAGSEVKALLAGLK